MWGDAKGSTVVEVAIALPIVVFLVIAIMFMGLYVNSQVVVNHAARVGAREYGISGDWDKAKEVIQNELSLGGLNGTFSIKRKQNKPEDRLGGRVEVRVDYIPVAPIPIMLDLSPDFFKVSGFADYRRDKP